MNRRYIATLAAIAVLTLGGGLTVRQLLQRGASAPAAGAPPSEAEALLQLSQEGLVRRLSSFLGDRASDVARFVEYVPSSRASGVRWQSNDTLVTTLSGQPVVTLHVERRDSTRTPLVSRSDSLRGELVLVVARRADGGSVWIGSVADGRVKARCEEQDVSEYVLGASIPDGFAGAGVFDLAGRIVALVVRCDGRLVALPAGEVTRLMNSIDPLNALLRTHYGFAVRSLDATARAYFGADSGWLITEVRANSGASRAGLVPGDIVLQVGGVDIDGDIPRALLDANTAPESPVAITLRREKARRTLPLARSTAAAPPEGGDVGIEFGPTRATAGVAITDVRPGSPADKAGLRVGDRLLRIGADLVNSRERATRAVARGMAADSVSFVVFQRDSTTRGVLVRR